MACSPMIIECRLVLPFATGVTCIFCRSDNPSKMQSALLAFQQLCQIAFCTVSTTLSFQMIIREVANTVFSHFSFEVC